MAYMSLDEKKMVVRVPIPQCKVRKRHNLFLAYGEKAIGMIFHIVGGLSSHLSDPSYSGMTVFKRG